MSEAIVVFNAGSTSLKFAAYDVDSAGLLALLRRGRIDNIQGGAALRRQRRHLQVAGHPHVG